MSIEITHLQKGDWEEGEWTEACLKPSWTCTIKLLCENSERFSHRVSSQKSSIVDVWLGSKHASGVPQLLTGF